TAFNSLGWSGPSVSECPRNPRTTATLLDIPASADGGFSRRPPTRETFFGRVFPGLRPTRRRLVVLAQGYYLPSHSRLKAFSRRRRSIWQSENGFDFDDGVIVGEGV